MATIQAQGKLSLDLNEARTDMTCYIDWLQLEQLYPLDKLVSTLLYFLLYLRLLLITYLRPSLHPLLYLSICAQFSHI